MVLLAHRRDNRNPPWQMPQGGMLPGELPEMAVMRELKEELGTDRTSLVTSCPHWLHYDYPPTPAVRRAQEFRGQRHKWFLLRFEGRDEDIDVATGTHAEFTSWRWATPAEVTASVVDFKRDVYAAVMGYFRPYLGDRHGAPQPIPDKLVGPSREQGYRWVSAQG